MSSLLYWPGRYVNLPVQLRYLPNFLTALRLVSVPFVVWLLAARAFRPALALVLVAGFTDWLDGFAARRLGVAGKAGAVFDPLADKAMLVALFLALGAIGRIPLWMVALAVVRDLVIVTGALLLRALRGVRRFSPSLLGKVSTFFQIILVLMVLVHAAFPGSYGGWLALAALALSALFTFLSGADYVRRGIVLARR